MQAVQQLRGHRAVGMTLALLVTIAALVLAGLVGYLVKGSTTLTTRTTVSAPAPAQGSTVQALPYGEHFSGSSIGSGSVLPYGEHYSAPAAAR